MKGTFSFSKYSNEKNIYPLQYFFIKKNLNMRNVDHIFLNIVFFSDWYVYH